ncbi:MAG: MarR family transcriptional regulator [Bacteroidota bacterium]
MDRYDLAKKLVLLVGTFQAENPEKASTVNNFLEWMEIQNVSEEDQEEFQITGHSMEVELAAHIGRLSRYSNTYIKMALVGLPFSTDMEFAFTAILDSAGPTGKTDLIRMMAYDKSSGMGVIKRLLKKGIIEEFPNPDDKRGKLLRLTKKGKEAVEGGYQKGPLAANLVSKNLTMKEKKTLLHLLRKLDNFHYPIYLNESQKDYLSS